MALLPVVILTGRVQLHHFKLVVDGHDLVVDLVVVWTVFIRQLVNQVEDHFYLGNFASGADPQLALGILEALGFNVFHLIYRVVALLAPLQLLIQEVEHSEVKAPQVIAPTQINIIVRIE